ncbi:MAG: OmpA family protein [Sandaracinaceae bacterium]|nr:OmpA family protein [Sandaracinaceae bacterium]
MRHELTYGLGLGLTAVRDVLEIVVEAYGATTMDPDAPQALFVRESSPLEVIGGLRLMPVRGFVIGVAAGSGLTRGYGSPDLRGVLTVGYAMPHEEATRAAPEPEEPPPPSDRDGDGLFDPQDSCPDEAEDRDEFQDEDGCPDPDNDGDGVLDADDQCPNEPEDLDQMGDEDGCIDSDNDADGIPDAADQCPNEPEDRDRFQDEDGCPDPDNDGDGVLDAADQCAFEPGHVENNGCPFAVRLDRETGQIRILQRVEFATGGDRILPRSIPVLEEVRSVIAANPQILRVRVEGHTDDRGNDRRNLQLSTRRARSVMRWLSEHGIEAARLEGQGCGELHALEANRTAAGRQANRRVEFHVVEPAPPQGVRALEGCTAVTPE